MAIDLRIGPQNSKKRPTLLGCPQGRLDPACRRLRAGHTDTEMPQDTDTAPTHGTWPRTQSREVYSQIANMAQESKALTVTPPSHPNKRSLNSSPPYQTRDPSTTPPPFFLVTPALLPRGKSLPRTFRNTCGSLSNSIPPHQLGQWRECPATSSCTALGRRHPFTH